MQFVFKPNNSKTYRARYTVSDSPRVYDVTLRTRNKEDAEARLKVLIHEHEQELRGEAAAQQQPEAPAADPEQLAQALQTAPDLDALYEVASRLDAITDEAQRLRLNDIFDARVAELEQA